MMETFSEIIYYIDEEGFAIKHYKDAVPPFWIYVDVVGPNYVEYQEWLDAGNSPTPIIGTPKETES